MSPLERQAKCRSLISSTALGLVRSKKSWFEYVLINNPGLSTIENAPWKEAGTLSRWPQGGWQTPQSPNHQCLTSGSYMRKMLVIEVNGNEKLSFSHLHHQAHQLISPNLHHPVGNVDLSLVSNELKNTAVSRPRRLLVGQLEQHRVDNVQPGLTSLISPLSKGVEFPNKFGFQFTW